MAELTKTELQAAAARAADLSLADDDVALQTANEPPDSVRATKLDTAGSDEHGAIYSLTRAQVDKALDAWGSEAKEDEPKGGNGRRRGKAADE